MVALKHSFPSVFGQAVQFRLYRVFKKSADELSENFFFRDLNTKDIIISIICRINHNLLCGFMFRLPADGRSR